MPGPPRNRAWVLAGPWHFCFGLQRKVIHVLMVPKPSLGGKGAEVQRGAGGAHAPVGGPGRAPRDLRPQDNGRRLCCAPECARETEA